MQCGKHIERYTYIKRYTYIERYRYMERCTSIDRYMKRYTYIQSYSRDIAEGHDTIVIIGQLSPHRNGAIEQQGNSLTSKVSLISQSQ